jgi:hypothetical protein
MSRDGPRIRDMAGELRPPRCRRSSGGPGPIADWRDGAVLIDARADPGTGEGIEAGELDIHALSDRVGLPVGREDRRARRWHPESARCSGGRPDPRELRALRKSGRRRPGCDTTTPPGEQLAH